MFVINKLSICLRSHFNPSSSRLSRSNTGHSCILSKPLELLHRETYTFTTSGQEPERFISYNPEPARGSEREQFQWDVLPPTACVVLSRTELGLLATVTAEHGRFLKTPYG